MPLSELVHRLAKGKFDSSQDKIPTCSTDMSIGPENDFVELVWENGQIQSSRGRKNQVSNGLPSQNSKIRDKDIGNGSNSKMGRFGAMDSVLCEVPMTVPSVGLGLNQDDEMVPWLNYPIDDSLQHDICSEFLTELSGVTVNENSQNLYLSLDRRSNGNQSIRDSHTVSVQNVSVLDQAPTPKVSSTEGPRTSISQLYPSSSQQCQSSFPYFRSKASVNNGENVNNLTRHVASGDSIRGPAPGGGFPSIKAQKQIPASSSSNSNLMNFSHFSRPVSLVKANLHNIGVRAGSGISSIERMGGKDKSSVASSSNPVVAPMFAETIGGLQKDLSSHSQPVMMSSKVDTKPLNRKPNEELLASKQPEALDHENDSRNDRSHCQIAESAIRGLADTEKNTEPVVASSSVCSGNSVERISDEPTQDLKRKNREIEESEGPSEDVEEESVGGKKGASARVNGAKRSRAAEVHNLSERRRRDRINEKMRALQELIPNCNKVDKASMLDEAIEYLKTLQLQVQIMSMGAGLYMPSMMLPPGMPHMHAPHMAQFPTMGIGMGMGMGIGFGMGMPDMIGGSSACSMMQMPPMHGAHFSSQPMSGPSTLHGMGGSNLPMFGLSSQGHPMPYHFPPLMPMSGGPLLKTSMGMNSGGVTGPMDNIDSAPASCSKDLTQNVNSQTMQNSVSKSPVNQTYNQCQATNEQPALLQNNSQAAEVPENGALKSSNGNESVPGGASGCD